MPAPVNPEGQTARDLTDEEIEAIHAWATVLHAKGCPKDASLLRRAVDQIERYAAQPSEGQTAQEVRRARIREAILGTPDVTEAARLLAVDCAADKHTATAAVACVDCIAEALALLDEAFAEDAALASTPSPIQTQSTKEEVHGGQEEGAPGSAEHDLREVRAGQRDAVPAGVRGAGGRDERGREPDDRGRVQAGDDAEAPAEDGGGGIVAPSPAKQTEQKIASAEGAALKSGAAPATPTFHEDGCGCPRCATAQPDARDAEIARLRKELDDTKRVCRERYDKQGKELEEARAAHQQTRDERDTIEDEFDQLALAHDGSEAKALREALRDLFWDNFPRNLPITRAVCTTPEWRAYQLLAPPEPKAETPAETAGQKEGAKPLVYLACPYSHPDREVRAARWALANYAAGELMAKGEKVFSPISHTHPIAEAHDLPLGWDFWEAFDRAYIGHSHKLIVLMLDGWRESKGVQAEIAIAQEMGIPVEYMDPPAPPSLHPAQPSQDVAGTSGESLAGLSKEKTE